MTDEGRIKALQKTIREHKLDGALLLYSRDIFYYTGTAQPSYFAVLQDDYLLFVRSGYALALEEAFIDQAKITDERRLERVYEQAFFHLKSKSRIATELDVLPAERFSKLHDTFLGHEFVNVSPFILAQRKKKDEQEIAKIRAACEVIDAGHRAVLRNLKEGLTELELAAAVEHAHRLAGHEGTIFIRQPDFFMSRGPLASGRNLFKISGPVYAITGVGLSAAVPLGPSRRRIATGDLVVVDIPTMVAGYHADQTRTYVVGKANPEIETMFQSLREIVDYLLEAMKPGMKSSEIYQMAVDKAARLGVSESFLKLGDGRRSRLIGHGVGLEVNEPPILSDYDHSILEDGYVITLEMHLMDENIGVVKLEDMILVSDTGNEILTKTPRELFAV